MLYTHYSAVKKTSAVPPLTHITRSIISTIMGVSAHQEELVWSVNTVAYITNIIEANVFTKTNNIKNVKEW